jgi:hypothetical protein
MAIEHGFGASVTNGLTFAYDTIDTLNSYLGEPTTNLVIAPDGNANVITTDVPPGVNVAGYAQYSDGYFVNPRNTVNTAATGRTFTYSVWMRSRTATPSTYLMYVFTGTGPDGGWWYFGDGPLTNQWTKYTYSRNDMTGTVSQVTVYRYNQQGTIEIAAPQIEINSRATQFVNGTRSATQGLLDLTGRSSINLSTMSFNSAANLVFDGTDDYISTGRLPADLGMYDSSYTAEAVVYPTSLSSDRAIFGTDQTAYRQGLHLTLRGGQIYLGHYSADMSGGFADINAWNHIVYRYDISTNTGSTFKNGVLQNSANIPSFIGTTPVHVGREFGNYNFGGEIPIAKIYNRALSQAEITQNFKKYQTRFGIV